MLLSDLLEVVLPLERVDLRFSRSDFAGRFGLRRRSDYTRFRFLGSQRVLPGVSELTLRTAELARLDLAPVVSLYVNDYNTAARRAYARVGFAQVGTFTSVLF